MTRWHGDTIIVAKIWQKLAKIGQKLVKSCQMLQKRCKSCQKVQKVAKTGKNLQKATKPFQMLGVTGFPKLDVFLENFRRGGGGSFPIQKITLQIFLVSKRYILVVNFGKNVQKGGEGGGHLQSKKFHCKFTQVNAYLRTFAKKSAM